MSAHHSFIALHGFIVSTDAKRVITAKRSDLQVLWDELCADNPSSATVTIKGRVQDACYACLYPQACLPNGDNQLGLELVHLALILRYGSNPGSPLESSKDGQGN